MPAVMRVYTRSLLERLCPNLVECSTQGGNHVGCSASLAPSSRGRQPQPEPKRPPCRRRRRRSGRVRPHGLRRRRAWLFSGAAPGARGGHRVVRVERVGSGAEEGLRERVQGVHEEDGDRRQGQHGRPQHVPGADQHVPSGPAPGRLHLVRRLPDAVLRVEGPALPDRRRLGAAQAAVCLGLPERLEGGGRALLLRPDLRLPVGSPLPQERVGSSTATRSRRRGISSSRSPRR